MGGEGPWTSCARKRLLHTVTMFYCAHCGVPNGDGVSTRLIYRPKLNTTIMDTEELLTDHFPDTSLDRKIPWREVWWSCENEKSKLDATCHVAINLKTQNNYDKPL